MRFRILPKILPHKSKSTGGLERTRVTIETLTKHPYESIEKNQKRVSLPNYQLYRTGCTTT
jgi:dGTP triphosphohydrolase